jgi:two-component system NtrC family sensor kinase
MRFFLQMLLPRRWAPGTADAEDLRRYRRIWWYTVTLTLFVSITPLLIMTGVNHYLFRKTVKAEVRYDISRTLGNIARSLQFVIEERLSALQLLVHEHDRAELSGHERLTRTFQNLKQSFGGFVDLGVIDADGDQDDYTGPYNLENVNYSDQDWFHEVTLRGVYVSDVFMGYRQFPHFVIAVKRETGARSYFVLRATVDMELLNRLIMAPGLGRAGEAFIVNRAGIMQTASRSHGNLLGPCTIPVPPYAANPQVVEDYDERGESFVLGYIYIEHTPFVLMVIEKRIDLVQEWLRSRTELFVFLLASMVLIHIVVFWSSTGMVRHIRAADRRRAQVMHNAEYTNKMATIGRLAASVAHEINNPLAIINEKAGFLQDLISVTEDFPRREKTSAAVTSILNSVERCSAVTHRLLGFTRKLEVRTEHIVLPRLLLEVMSFLDKEALHRNIEVQTQFAADAPAIESDRGQLQQVFLNIINNAFAAVQDGGRIELGAAPAGDDRVKVTIRDDGTGIRPEDLKHIFEPFFSTKGEFGTGLGLSITYNLVQKLGGHIEVESEYGRGACFTVILPVKRPAIAE